MNEKVESGLEVATFWVLFDATAEQRFIKKDARDGTLAFFDSEHQAIRAKRAHADTDYKRVDYVRQSDAERALQQQHEAHRKTWRQLEQVKGLLREAFDSLCGGLEEGPMESESSLADRALAFRITAALSQQDEPECLDCRAYQENEQNPNVVCDECGWKQSEPAPAQDERTAFEAWVMQHNTAVREDYDDTDENAPEDIRLDRHGGVYIWANAEAAWFAWKARSALDRRPAQTEQQPEQSNLEPLLNAGAALSNIAYNLAQRPGVTLDKIVCDTLSSARKSWDAARAAMDAKEE